MWNNTILKLCVWCSNRTYILSIQWEFIHILVRNSAVTLLCPAVTRHTQLIVTPHQTIIVVIYVMLARVIPVFIHLLDCCFICLFLAHTHTHIDAICSNSILLCTFSTIHTTIQGKAKNGNKFQLFHRFAIWFCFFLRCFEEKTKKKQ